MYVLIQYRIEKWSKGPFRFALEVITEETEDGSDDVWYNVEDEQWYDAVDFVWPTVTAQGGVEYK